MDSSTFYPDSVVENYLATNQILTKSCVFIGSFCNLDLTVYLVCKSIHTHFSLRSRRTLHILCIACHLTIESHSSERNSQLAVCLCYLSITKQRQICDRIPQARCLHNIWPSPDKHLADGPSPENGTPVRANRTSV